MLFVSLWCLYSVQWRGDNKLNGETVYKGIQGSCVHVQVVVDTACIQDNGAVCAQTDGSYKTGEELGMNTAAFPPLEISRELKTCRVIDVYI